MNTEQTLKQLVKEKYGQIARQSPGENASSCCGATCCSLETGAIMADDYSQLSGYQPSADLALGCGLPTEFAHIKPGDTVIDLGSGAGNDAFVARSLVGASGKVIGIDFTPAMLEKARHNAVQLGFDNVEFREGDIEFLPVADNTADVVVSNCVLNLVPNKKAVIAEMFRVLKPGGHFSVSDIALRGALPEGLQQAAEMYAGCVSGAIDESVYLSLLNSQGFEAVKVQREKNIVLPDDVLQQYLDEKEMEQFTQRHRGIVSITVYGRKPESGSCCGPACCAN